VPVGMFAYVPFKPMPMKHGDVPEHDMEGMASR
jgi:hypothetical protein